MALFKKIKSLLKEELIRHTFWMCLSYGSRLVIQAGYFVIIARTLGVQQYGLFVGLVALATTAVPFATWGSEHILVKNVARDRNSFSQNWGLSLMLSVISGLILTLICFVVGKATLPTTTSPLIIGLILTSELVGRSINLQASKAFLAVNYVKGSALIANLVSLKNLGAAMLLLIIPKQGANELLLWTGLYCLSTLIAAIHSYHLVDSKIGKPDLSLSLLKQYEFREGFYFSVNQSASSVNANIDKTMLAGMSTLDATGIYAAAYRIVEISTVPIRAVMTAAYAKFFKSGAEGVSGAMSFAKKVLKLSCAYGILIAVVLPLIAPIVPLVLGDEYADSVDAMRWLAPMVILLAARFPVADVLSSTNNQGIRSAVQLTTALINVGLNWLLIPQFSWKGSAWATLISDGLQTIGLWLIVLFLLRKQQAKSQESTELSSVVDHR